MPPKVSVVIPNYNHAKYLEKRIDSILNQSFQDFEIIILDDASTDNSLEIIKKYKNDSRISKIIANKKNSGSPFAQWNKGIREAQGEYIWIAESDDIAKEEFLLSIMILFDTNKSLGIVFCQSEIIDENDHLLGNYEFNDEIFNQDFIMAGNEFIHRYMSTSNNIPNASAVVFEKKLFDMIDGADTTLKLTGDWLFWLKILPHTKVAFLHLSLNLYRFHPNNARSKTKILRNCEENIKVLYYVADNFFNNKLERKAFLTQIKRSNIFFQSIEKHIFWEIYQGNIFTGFSYLLKQVLRTGNPGYWFKNLLYWLTKRIKNSST